MAFDPKVFSKKIFDALYESNRFFNKCDRSHDGEVTDVWAKSVDIYVDQRLYVSNAAVAKNSTNRKKGSGGTTVNVPFTSYVIPLKEELEERMATNGQLLERRAMRAAAALEEKLDANVYAAAVDSLPTGNKKTITGSNFGAKDLSQISKFFNTNRIPKMERYGIVPVALEDEFNDIDIVKSAQSFNRQLFEEGVTRINGVNYIISADAPQVDGKDAIIGIWAPSIAVVIKSTLKREEAYDPDTADKDVDYLAYAGIKRAYDDGCMVVKMK